MKINLITPFKMQWIKGFTQTFENRGWQVEVVKSPFIVTGAPDVNLFMWCDDNTFKYINNNKPIAKNIVFIRRFEYFSAVIDNLRWDRVDRAIMVNHYLAGGFKKRTGFAPEVIFNGVVSDDWSYKPRSHGKNIALVGFVNYKKNLPMAVQILNALPDHTLHIAGRVQDGAVFEYLNHISSVLGNRIKYHGHIKNVNEWLEDKNYILSTALTEGNPNNIIEAMTKGIKPVVHNWPGCKQQFAEFLFNTIGEAVEMISPESEYTSEQYHQIAKTRFGQQRFEDVADIIEEVTNG